MYNDVIPLLISYFPPTTTTNTTVTISNEISKNVGCIHNDIIKYKNYSYCRHVNKNRNNDDDVIRNNELINKIVSINQWLIENNKVVISLFNKQSYDYICLCCNGWSAINKTDKNVDKVNKDINKVYNIDFALIDIDSRIIRVILINNNLSYEIKEKFIEIMTNKTLEKYVLESVVNWPLPLRVSIMQGKNWTDFI